MKQKAWTFSRLFFRGRYFPDYREKKYILKETVASLWISSVDEEFISAMIEGLLKDRIVRIDNTQFEVMYVQSERIPNFEEDTWYRFSCLSPYCASTTKDRFIYFFPAHHPELPERLIRNAQKKFCYYFSKNSAPELEIKIDEKFLLKKKATYMIQYKTNKKGYTNILANQVPLFLKGSPEMLRFLYLSGIGERTSAGFGMLRYDGICNKKSRL